MEKRITLICGENCDLRDSRMLCSGSSDGGVSCDGGDKGSKFALML